MSKLQSPRTPSSLRRIPEPWDRLAVEKTSLDSESEVRDALDALQLVLAARRELPSFDFYGLPESVQIGFWMWCTLVQQQFATYADVDPAIVLAKAQTTYADESIEVVEQIPLAWLDAQLTNLFEKLLRALREAGTRRVPEVEESLARLARESARDGDGKTTGRLVAQLQLLDYSPLQDFVDELRAAGTDEDVMATIERTLDLEPQ